MSQAHINQSLKTWHNGDGGGHTPQYIVATTASFGVGLTLTEAYLLCLLEPEYRAGIIKQLFHRIHRYGQVNSHTITKLMYILGNELEQAVRELSKTRGQISQVYDAESGAAASHRDPISEPDSGDSSSSAEISTRGSGWTATNR